jgi:hypothetical protein
MGMHTLSVATRRALSRRALFAGSGATFVMAITRPTTAAAQLLDPSQLGKSSTAAMPSGPGPGYARGMASRTVSALMSLVSAYAASGGKFDGLRKAERDLRSLLSTKTANRIADLEEFRQGLFCSGCRKTRRQILSEGSVFPHPGQTIIQPTQAEIDQKAKSLQDDIDATAQKLNDALKQYKPVTTDLDRIRNEIFEGGLLWRSAVAFEDALIIQASADAEREYQSKRTHLTDRFKAITEAETVELDMRIRQRLADELLLMTTTLTSLENRRETQRRGSQLALNNAEQAARLEGGRFQTHVATSAAKIQDGGYRGFLDINGMLLTKSATSYLPNDRATGGRAFQMGDYSPATWGAIRADVAEFLDRAGQRLRGLSNVYYPTADNELRSIRALAVKLSQPHPDAPPPTLPDEVPTSV